MRETINCGPRWSRDDLGEVDPQALARPIPLGRHLLARRHDRLGLAELDDDRLVVGALDEAVDDLADAVVELVVDVLALVFADALQDDLLGRLRGDAAEVARRILDQDLAAELGVALDLAGVGQRDLHLVVLDGVDDGLVDEDARLARARVDAHGDVLLDAAGDPLIGGLQGVLDRADDGLFRDAPLGRDRRDRGVKFALHGPSALPLPRPTEDLTSAACLPHAPQKQRKWVEPTPRADTKAPP